MDLKLRCSASGCECPNFGAAPSKETLRICDGCSHSWMTHLLEKLLTSRDDALSIFDVCSLALYGTHALPIRIKIVMERLLSTLQAEEVDKILRSFGWSLQDLARGYMVQDPRTPLTSTQQPPPPGSPPPTSTLFPNMNNNLMTRWTIIPRDEELLILQQFLRFPATRTLSFSLLRDEFPMNINGSTTTPPQQPAVSAPPSNFPPAMAAAAATAAAINSLNPLNKFNGLFGLGMNLLPAAPQPPPPIKREVISPVQPPQQIHKKKEGALNLTADKNGYEGKSPVDLSFNEKVEKKYTPPQHPHKKEEPRRSRASTHAQQVNQKHRSSWERENTARSPIQSSPLPPNHHHHHHHMHHLNLVPPPPPPPPPPPTMAAAVAASAAAAVNAAAVTAQQLVNPVTGKRRVQCAVCLKTFCDKGALKIHFSAVHLREMHKCTVQGCNMMFSSRRSRNRHSANPNPKLHSPHLRRKISPHDGRTAQPLISLNNPMLYGHAAAAMAAMGRMGPNPHQQFVGNGFRAQDKDKKKKGPHSTSTSDSEDPQNQVAFHSDDEDDSYMMVPQSDDEEDDGTGIHIPDHMMMVGAIKKEADSDSFSSEEIDKQTLSPENNPQVQAGSRKRKLNNPVRLPSVADEDDDLCCYDNKPKSAPSSLLPTLINSTRSLSRTPELMPAEDGVEENGAKEKEYNLRKKPHPSMAEFDIDDDIEDDDSDDCGGNNNGTTTGSSSPPLRMKNNNFWGNSPTQPPNRAFEEQLMHKCTVDGCNASFPSKRSRDRHASNYNLHKKLLSTCSDNDESSINSNLNSSEQGKDNNSDKLLVMLRNNAQQQCFDVSGGGGSTNKAFQPPMTLPSPNSKMFNDVVNPFLPPNLLDNPFNPGLQNSLFNSMMSELSGQRAATHNMFPFQFALNNNFDGGSGGGSFECPICPHSPTPTTFPTASLLSSHIESTHSKEDNQK